jgi:hypothetical protein
MTPRQYRLIGYDDGLNGSASQYPRVYEYMAAFRQGRRNLIRDTITKIRRQHLWVRQVREKDNG